MKPIVILLLAFWSSYTFSSLSIYGNDDRRELRDSKVANLAQLNVPSIIQSKYLEKEGSKYKISSEAISRNADRFCEEARFSKQVSISSCTGVLISSNKVLTAGHCMEREDDCSNKKFVFGWYMTNDKEIPTEFEENFVYGCKKILVMKWNNKNIAKPGVDDYAIIELDRHVNNLEPSKLDLDSNFQIGDSVFAIGSTSGWPQKLSSNARIIDIHKNIIESDLDISSGNSGGPVFNERTKEVVAINHSGNNDGFLFYDSKRGCLREEPFSERSLILDQKKIEERRKQTFFVGNIYSMKLSSIVELKWTKADWHSSIYLENRNYSALIRSIESDGTTPNIYNSKTGDTALIQSIKESRMDLFKFLLDHQVDINLTSQSGKSPIEVSYETKNMEIFNLLLNREEIDLNLILYNAINSKDLTLVKTIADSKKIDGDTTCNYCQKYMSFKDYSQSIKDSKDSEMIYKIIKGM